MKAEEWKWIDAIPGFMDREECEWLSVTASHVESWVEVGTYCGRSALCVALALPPGASLTLVDRQFPARWYPTWSLIDRTRPDIRLRVLQVESLAAAELVPWANVVFIDGDHSEAAVAGDIHAWREKGTVLAGHDYQLPAVRMAVEALLPQVSVCGTIWSTT